MRLIDADTLMERFEGLKGEESQASMFAEEMAKMVEAQPTAYDLDKVVEELDKCHMVRAIDVVRRGGYYV